MRRIRWFVLYAVALCALLAAAGVWLYHTPSQVEARLTRELARVFDVPVTLGQCRDGLWDGRLNIGSLLVPAKPVIEEGTLLRANGLRSDETVSGIRRRTAGNASLTKLRVADASLHLEYKRALVLAETVGQWNFASVLCASGSEAGAVEILVDKLAVSLRFFSTGERPRVWSFGLRSVLVRPTVSGFQVSGDLSAGELWRGGRISLQVTSAQSAQISGELDDFRLSPELRELLPPKWKKFLEQLDTRKAIDLDIQQLALTTGQPPKFDVTVRNYDSEINLGSLRLTGVRGPVQVTQDELRFGVAQTGEPLLADSVGVTVSLEGTIGRETGDWSVRVPPTELREIALASRRAEKPTAGEELARLVQFLAPRGELSGEINGRFWHNGVSTWTGEFAFQKVHVARWPWLAGAEGRLHVRGGGERRDGRLTLTRMTWKELGTVEGVADLQWDDSRLQLYLADLKVGTEWARPGSIQGSTTWQWSGEPGTLDMTWSDLQLQNALFSAQKFTGSTRSGSDGTLRGVFTTGPGELKPRDFTIESAPFAFQSGRGTFALQHGQVDIGRLLLSGVDVALRGRGTVHSSGALDFDLVHAAGDAVLFQAVELDSAPPAAWCKAAGVGCRGFSLTGTTARPRLRQVDPKYQVQ